MGPAGRSAISTARCVATAGTEPAQQGRYVTGPTSGSSQGLSRRHGSCPPPADACAVSCPFRRAVRRDLARVDHPDEAVGIDLGVKTLAVMADSAGEIREVANPRHLDTALKQLRCASRTVSRRQGPDRRTRQESSKRWEKANAARNRVHHRVANLREDALHKLTSAITGKYGTVGVETATSPGPRTVRQPLYRRSGVRASAAVAYSPAQRRRRPSAGAVPSSKTRPGPARSRALHSADMPSGGGRSARRPAKALSGQSVRRRDQGHRR